MASKKDKAQERAARAQAALEAQRRAERRRNIVRGAIAVVVMALVVAVGIVIGNRHGDKVDAAAASASSDYGLVVGPSTAAHKVVIYEDFLCPICGYLEANSHEKLAELAAAGKVQIDYRPFDLLGGGDPGSYSVRSAAAFSVVLDKSGPDVAKKFHDLLYAQQPSEEGPFPDDNALLADAVQAGANEADVKDGILNATGVPWVTSATAAATKAKVNSTPTVLLDGKPFDYKESVQTLTTDLLKAVS